MFLFTVSDLRAAADQWGLIPAEMFRHGGLTLVSCFFLHGGIFHLIGNVYFLLILGDNCEDLLGPWRYMQLLVAATVVGALAHIALNIGSPIPCIGASGGISGIIAYYALRHPETKVGRSAGRVLVALPLGVHPGGDRLPALGSTASRSELRPGPRFLQRRRNGPPGRRIGRRGPLGDGAVCVFVAGDRTSVALYRRRPACPGQSEEGFGVWGSG